ncbi:MAG: LysM peptidoglycan-binding domain-containing protein, partial [Tidjanibacter sp.]|nr:LysM peptidoglycan-binding domain-containing protein [Tidjanibacter sp.]
MTRVRSIMCARLGVLLCGLTGEAFGQQRSDVVVGIDSQNYYLHTLAEGEGVAEVAGLYGLSADEICQANQIAQGEEVAEGRVLRVPCYERVSKLAPKRGDRRYERYAVAQGKSLFDVAVENAISLDTLVVDNPGVDITDISNCRTLNVRLSAKGLTQLADIERASRRYAALLDGLSTEYEYFVVESGQTLYSLGVKHCKGVDVLAEENGYPEVI